VVKQEHDLVRGMGAVGRRKLLDSGRRVNKEGWPRAAEEQSRGPFDYTTNKTREVCRS
jgi:hypothetical protein